MKRVIEKLVVFLLIILVVLSGFYDLKLQIDNNALEDKITDMTKTITAMQAETPTAAHIASQTTVQHPSYLNAAWYDSYIKKYTHFRSLTGAGILKAEKDTKIAGSYLLAIAILESGGGTNTFAKDYNNIMSWGIETVNKSNGLRYVHYKSQDYNLQYTAEQLHLYYIKARGLMSLAQIGARYCNTSWSSKVFTVLNLMKTRMPGETCMRQYVQSTGIFAIPTTWDTLHETLGWALWNVERNKTVAGS